MPQLARKTKDKLNIRLQEHHDPDVQLMLLAGTGDRAAFDLLVERHWSLVFQRLFRLLGDRQEAEDLTQEVFMRLFRSRTRYTPKAKFSTLLYHITQNVYRNALRARKRRVRVHLNNFATDSPCTVPESLLTDLDPSPSERLERSEAVTLVRAAISELLDRQRQALEMHQFHDFSYAEIGEIMSMSAKAAKSLLYRARAELRIRLAGSSLCLVETDASEG